MGSPPIQAAIVVYSLVTSGTFSLHVEGSTYASALKVEQQQPGRTNTITNTISKPLYSITTNLLEAQNHAPATLLLPSFLPL